MTQSQLEKQIGEVRRRRESEAGSKTNLQFQIKDLEAKLKSETNCNIKYREDNQTLKESLASVTSKNEHLQEKVSSLSKTKEEHVDQLQSLHKELEIVQVTNKELDQKKEELLKALTQKETDLKSLREKTTNSDRQYSNHVRTLEKEKSQVSKHCEWCSSANRVSIKWSGVICPPPPPCHP